jgi:hypothetical protein
MHHGDEREANDVRESERSHEKEKTERLDRNSGDHANPIAREGGVVGEDEVGDGVGGEGRPSRVI